MFCFNKSKENINTFQTFKELFLVAYMDSNHISPFQRGYPNHLNEYAKQRFYSSLLRCSSCFPAN